MSEKYFGFCPCCEKETNQTHVVGEIELIYFHEDPFNVVEVQIPADYYYCKECRGRYDKPRSDYDPLALAYAEYKRITGKEWKGKK